MLPVRKFTGSDLKIWKDTIFDIYYRMRAKAQKPYEVEYGGQIFIVFPNVYAPEFFDDTLWYAKRLQAIVGKKSLLEIGTGTGVIAIFAAQAGSMVVATDVNPDAVENAKINVEKHGLGISVRKGDVYDPIKSDEKFDFIFWAHPFNAWDLPEEDMLLRSGIDPHYESLEKYIAGARGHLTDTGKLLLGTGDSADLIRIEELAIFYGYELKLLCEIEQPLERGQDKKIRDLIYEFVKKGDIGAEILSTRV